MKRSFKDLAVDEASAVDEGAVSEGLKRDGDEFTVKRRRAVGRAEVEVGGSSAAVAVGGESESSEEGVEGVEGVEGGESRSQGSCDSLSPSAGDVQTSSPQPESSLSRDVRAKLAKAVVNSSQPIFTRDEVKEICLHAINEREQRIHEEFDTIYHERLAEQFQTFTQVNRDFLFRAYREPQNTYVS